MCVFPLFIKYVYEWWNYHVDADGLRDFILNHGWVITYHNPHQSLDDYYALADDDIKDIAVERQSQIHHMHFVARYDDIKNPHTFDFSSFHFSQLQSIFIGRIGFFECRNIHFTSKNWLYYCIIDIDLPSLTEIVVDESGFNHVHEIAFVGK